MANRIQLRRDGAQQWANVNPILAQGELGIELDTSRLKIGDGVTPWNSLKYERPLETESNTANTLVKRDADGNFEAGAITASIIGNAATATRLANARSFTLTGDMSGSASFDGSANINITAELNYQPGLPHYDPNNLSATAQYTRLTIDSRGRVTTGDNPTTLAAYGIADAQPADAELQALADMTGFGLISRTGAGTLANRQIAVSAGRLLVSNGTGVNGNPLLDLADTPVVVGSYNPVGNLDTPLVSVTTGDETVNTTNFTVDRYGRLTAASTSAIATATQGSEIAAFNNGTNYVRNDKVKNTADKLYQAILPINSGGGEPTHTDTSDTGSWRYLGSALAPQKGLASFNQEDFDVTQWDAGSNYEGGFVTIAQAGVDNDQLQNSRIGFADGNTLENFDLDQELTATTGYRGFNYLNYTKVNDTTGNLLVGANNTGNGSSGNQQAVQNVVVTLGTDTVGGQSTGVFYLDGVESPTNFPLKKGIKYIFNQDDSTNETFGGANHPLMVSSGADGDHNGHGHYMMGITYKLDGSVVNMAGYVSGFNAATTRRMEWLVQAEAPANLYYWCHHHTGQGDSFAITEGGAGELDINVRSYFSHPDITLDGAISQTLDKTGDGDLYFQLTQNTASNRNLNILSTNAGAGNATILIQSENDVTINASNVSNRVNVEGFQFQDDTLSSTAATMILDPGDDDAATGKVQIRGDLQVDGTTTTVNSTVVTIDDPIFTLGGDTAPGSDDNKDRGIEFRYYDTQARLGFFGWDEDYADSNIWSGTGGYRLLYNATNTSEVFSGTDAPLIVGNLRLTTNTGSTSTTTGTLVVTGGLGLSENAHIGGTVTIAGQSEVNNNVIFKADNKSFSIQNASAVNKFSVDYDNGNTIIEGTLDVQLETEITDNLIIKADNKKFDIQTAAGVSVFDVDTDNGNTHTDGTLDVDGGTTLNNTLDVDGATTLNDILDVDLDATFHDDITLDTTGKYFKITNGSNDKFTVLSTNGDTDIRGTLDVGSAVVFENNFNANGNNTTIGNANTDVFTVNSVTTFTDNITVNGTVDFDTTLNVDGQADFNSTVVIDGQTTIYDSVIIQSDNEVFNINNASAQTQFSIDSDNGNTVIGRAGLGTDAVGLLTVHGDTLLNRDLTVDGNTTIGDANTDTLTVNSESTFNADVTIAGTNNLQVTGNAIVDGNLTVHGTTTTVNSTVVTLDDPIITLGGDTAPGSDDGKDRGVEFRYYSGSAKIGWFGWDNDASRFALYDDATNSSEVFSGTRSGIDAGSLKLFDTTNATNSSTGTLIVGGGAGIGLDLHVGDDLIVVDDASIGGNLDVTGTFDVTNDLAVNNTKFTVDAGTGNTIIQGTVQVDGNATIGNASGDQHTVTGTVTFNQAITSTDITADNIQIGVSGATEIDTTSGNLVLDSAGGTIHITDHADIDGNLNVDGNQQLDGTLTVDSTSTFKDHVTLEDDKSLKLGTGADASIQYISSIDVIWENVSASQRITQTPSITIQNASGQKFFKAGSTDTGLYHVGSQKLATTSGGVTVTGLTTTDTLAVNSTSTFSGAITSTDITADNIRIGVAASSEIDTTSGSLTLDSNTGETIIDDNLTVNGTLDVDALTTITDALTVKADNKLFSVQTGSAATIFSVDTDNGNTDIQGTLNVEGATTIDDTFNVTQATDLDGTLNVDGVATFQNNVVLNADNKEFAIQLDDGTDKFTVQSATGNTDIQGTLDVNGATNVTNTLGVTGLTSLTNNTNPTSLSANAALMVTQGGLTVDEDVYVGSDLFIGPNAGTTITLNGGTGNATIGGTLGVTGQTTLTTISATSLTTSAGVTMDGSLIINTDKFTVAGATGNTAVDGTLDVNGATNITDNLTVTGAVDFDTTLNVDGNSTFSGTITQNSTSLFKDNIVLRGSTKTLKLQNGSGTDKITLNSTSGAATFAGLTTTNTLDVTSNTTIGGTLGVTGQITGNVTGALTGNADTATLVNITETGSSNLTYYPTFVSATTGNTEIRTDSSNLTYNPSTNTLTVNNFKSTTDFEVQGNLTITGNITYAQSEVGSIANHDTDALTEGTSNLYYTEERVDDRVAALISGGTGISATYNDAGNLLTLSADFGEFDTDDVNEGTSNKYFTQARTRNAFTYGTGIEHDGSGGLQVTQSDINTDNVTEGSTNLFTTAARTRGHISVSGDLGYNASTGVISYTIPTTIASLSNHDTDDVAEGSSNLYYTDERVDDRLNAVIVAGTGVTKVYDDAANTYTLSVTQADVNTDTVTEGSTNLFTTAARTRTHFTYGTGITHSSGTLSVTQSDINTDNVTEGSTNLFTTAARTRTHFTYGTGIELSGGGELSVTQADIDTDNVTEGSTNLFTTAARTRGHISVGGDLAYNSGTGVISFTERTDAEVNTLADARIAAADTDDLSEGSTNLYFTNARADARVTAGITGKLDASAVSTFGGTLIDDADAAAARTTLGLGTAAVAATGDFATAAQGTKADSATQPGDLSTVATSGDYDDLSNKPTLGTAAAAATGDFATAAQGTLATNAAPLASPGLTGTPTAPTAAQATNTTQVATTAFVQSNLTAALLRTALGIVSAANDAGSGLASGEMYFNTTSNTYVLVA